MVPSSLRAPAPPHRFRGSFVSDGEAIERASVSSGPFRRRPLAVASPSDAEDVARLVSWAATEGVALVPRGAGTGMPGGNVGDGVVLDLTGLGGVRVLDADRGLLEAGPGATGAALDRAAGALGRFVPPMPSSAERCTVGGMVANDAAGVRSFGYGPVHAWVEAVDLVLADGSFARLDAGARGPTDRFAALRASLAAGLGPVGSAWPSVAKNASGYALDRFLGEGGPLGLVVGSEGTLGVVTRVVLRTAPLPECRGVALIPVPELRHLDACAAFARSLGASACEFFGARFLDVAGLRNDPALGGAVGRHPALLLVEVDGAPARVRESLSHLDGFAEELGVAAHRGTTPGEQEALWGIRHAASPVVAARASEGLVSMQFIEDSVVPRGRLADYLQGLDGILAQEETDAVVFGHAGDANVHVNPLVDVTRPDWRERVGRILDRTVTLVAALGGTLSGEHGDGRLRAPFHDRVFGAPWAEAFRHTKETLDPAGILNPGVVVPIPGQDPLAGLSAAGRGA